MKKTSLIAIALATISAINGVHAESSATISAQAVLDNDFPSIKLHAKQLPQEELAALIEIAKQKNAFYQTRFNRWKTAHTYAIYGLPLSLIIGVVTGAIGGLVIGSMADTPTSSGWDLKFGAALGTVLGTPTGALAGSIATNALIIWTQKNANKWQKELDTSNSIIEFLEDKITSTPQ